jgi:hypothetical protein
MLNLLSRAFTSFSLTATVAGLAAAWADGDHLLESDDPYIVGLLLGAVAAVQTALYLGLKRLLARSPSKHLAEIIYAVGLLLWAAFWLAADWYAVEGKGIGLLIAVAGGATGIVVWPLCRFQLPKVATATIALLGISFIACYAYIAVRLT